MFDPSKLDLELGNGENNPENKEKEAESIENIIVEEEKKPEEIKNDDILGEIKNLGIVEENVIPKVEETIIQKPEENVVSETENKSSEEEKKDDSLESMLNNVIPDTSIMDSFGNNGKSIIDINISSIKDLLNILIGNNYDFLTIEPNDQDVKIRFFKDSIEKDIKNIKFPIYSQILIKTKSIAKLNVEESEKEQEGVGEVILNSKNYKFISKTSPSNFGEKVFIKLEEVNKQIKKEGTKMSVGQIFSFIGTIAFVALVVGGGFISFIVLNANTVDDVKFFSSLGISLNDINTFILKVVTIIFSILTFLETILLIIFLFKFGLTKKEFKQKKIKYLIFSIIFFIITFSTASAWMYIDQKIKSLPNWQEMAYGMIQIYDNSKLISDKFDKGGALLKDTTNLIGPIQIKFDLTFFADKEIKSGMKIKKYIWNFGGGENIETQTPTIIRDFDKKGVYKISLTIEEIDLKGATIEKVVEDIPNIELSYAVAIELKNLSNGGKQLKIDASSLKELGKIQWYSLDSGEFDISKSIAEGYVLNYGKPIFEESIIGMYIKRNDKESEELDKIFIITGEDKSDLNGEITYKKTIEDDLEYEFQVDNINVNSGNGFVEEFKWIVGKGEKIVVGDIENPTESSKLKYKFEKYGEQTVKVILKDSSGGTKELSIKIDIQKIVKLKSNLKIYKNDELISDVRYEEKTNEYYINSIGVPTKLKFEAKDVSTDDYLYNLQDVSWDFDSNGSIDETGKTISYDLNSTGNHTISLEYKFVHRGDKEKIITIKEKIFIEAVKKESEIDFKMDYDSDYAPVTVKFDGSKSKVKNDDIKKFIWNFGDGTPEETRDSIVLGHKYTTDGDYTIKLTVVTETGKEYSISKELILKPKPQSVKINSSMKTANIEQGIDFFSNESQGQIVEYFWDFGDGETSTKANPTHSYSKPGTYIIKLKVDFVNNNVLEDEMEIKITE